MSVSFGIDNSPYPGVTGAVGVTQFQGVSSYEWFQNPDLKLNDVAPNLVYNFLNNQFYNSVNGATPNPFLNVRAGNAMHFDAQGRLVWAQANMFNRSNDILGASWTKNALTVTESSAAPSPTGDKVYLGVLDNGASTTGNDGIGGVFQALAGQPNTAWVCFSVYARAGEVTSIRLREQVTTGLRYNVNLITGVPTLEFGTPTNSIVQTQNVGNGWWRVSWFYRTQSTSISFIVKSGLDTGDGVSGFYLSSPQMEMLGPDSPKNYLSSGSGTTAVYRPRFDYNPQTLSARGYLVEAAKTNLLPRSETAVVGDWNNASNCVATYTEDIWNRPVSRITVNSTASAQFNFINTNSVTPTASTIHTLSCFVKKGNIERVQLATSANYADAYLNYNFDTNTIVLGGANVVANSGHAQIMQSGWVRLQFSYTSIAVPVAGTGCIIAFIDTDAALRLAGTTTNGAFVDCFGMQLETLGVASSYIPTFGSSVTRVADQPVLTSLPWLTQDRGTLYVEIVTNKADANSRRFVDLNDNSSNNRVQITRSTVYTGVSSVAGISDFSPSSSASTNFATEKAVLRYSSSGKVICANGGTVNSNAVSPPTSGYTHIYFGNIVGFIEGNCPFGWIREVRYYPDATASNAQLQALTTV